MSTQTSQQIITRDRTGGLPTSSERQPGRMPKQWPGGIEAGLAATVLAALCLFSTLCYGIVSAIGTQNGYAAMRVRGEIGDLRAEEALLRYQINLNQSKVRIVEAAQRLELQLADPVRDVDYIAVPVPSAGDRVQVATGGGEADRQGLPGILAGMAEDLVGSAGGQAEASVDEGHRP